MQGRPGRRNAVHASRETRCNPSSWKVRYTLVLRFNPDTIHYAFRDQYTVCIIKNVRRKTYLCVDVSNFFYSLGNHVESLNFLG
jgi:hypothetical protein